MGRTLEDGPRRSSIATEPGVVFCGVLVSKGCVQDAQVIGSLHPI